MLKRLSKLLLFITLFNLMPSNFQAANADEILWNPGLGVNLEPKPENLVPGAQIRGLGLLVYKSNPDKLIMKIVMNNSFEEAPFSNKGRNIAMMLWIGREGCYYSNRLDCDRMQTVWTPDNPSTYPTSKSSQYVYVYNRDQKLTSAIKNTNCKAPWWIESSNKYHDTWAFEVSITCLDIPKEFGIYAYSGIDIGQEKVAYDFSSAIKTTYPFYELAKPAFNSISGAVEKSDLINAFKSLSASGKKQSKSLKNQILKSKKLSALKKKSFLKLIKEFDSYAKKENSQLSELESLPLDDNFRSISSSLTSEWQDWLQKFKDIQVKL